MGRFDKALPNVKSAYVNLQEFTPDLQKIYTDISAISLTLCNSGVNLPNSSVSGIAISDAMLTLLCMASPHWPSTPSSQSQDKFPRLGRSCRPNLPEKKSFQWLKWIMDKCWFKSSMVWAPPLPSGRKHCLHQHNQNGRWKLHLPVSTTHSPQQTPKITQNYPT